MWQYLWVCAMAVWDDTGTVYHTHDNFGHENICIDGFKKSIRTQHVEKFSIQSGNATPAPPKNLSPPNSISILKMEEDSWGVWGWRYRTGRRKRNFESRRYAEFFDTSCPN